MAGFIQRLIRYLESVISGQRRGFFPAMLRAGLLQISRICSVIMRLRRWFYTRGILRSKCLPCRVISVGNVVVGGSGKTPAVVTIARMLEEHTNSIAVLSRGYRSKTRGATVVSDGRNILLNWAEAGDEPYMLSRSLPGIPVLIGKDRYQTGTMAIHEWGCRIVILDDGFQYLKLARDIDIITVDATRPFGFDHILPRGYLREPLSTLRRADLILLTRVDQCENPDSVCARLTRIAPSVPVFQTIHKPRFLCSLDTCQRMGLEVIRDKNVLAVCGIANPRSFAETLRSLKPTEVTLLSFPDHHTYPPSSMASIRQRAAELAVDFIVATEKDAPKLRPVAGYEVLSLVMELELVGETVGEFLEIVKQKCGLSNE